MAQVEKSDTAHFLPLCRHQRRKARPVEHDEEKSRAASQCAEELEKHHADTRRGLSGAGASAAAPLKSLAVNQRRAAELLARTMHVFGSLVRSPTGKDSEKLPAALLPQPFSREPLPAVSALKRSWCHGPEVLGTDLFQRERIVTLGGLPPICPHRDPARRGGGRPEPVPQQRQGGEAWHPTAGSERGFGPWQSCFPCTELLWGDC